MSIRAGKKRRPRDLNQVAYQVVLESTGQAPPEPPDTRNPAAVALSQLGAAKGGNARSEKLSPRRRKQIARKAAQARYWPFKAANGVWGS